ncbi:Irregular chiasm C-roughest protein [Lepeophtheirus salmonis]|uniref:Irregular chiasm C-roughest protein n=1 Tax=Lepeophtheirus salmonis TaxID=72036 RepID=A0A7R8H0F8_LEPSM|nr:Irregular chiasm C-roughest protein [Lepeophtheirus salmonis]CAF2783310.1 Irregular chiasm C-roughest protein [Lepeophtheirus salmonis]
MNTFTSTRPKEDDRREKQLFSIVIKKYLQADLRNESKPIMKNNPPLPNVQVIITHLTVVESSIGESTPSPQVFLREPVDQTARQGTHVTLPCRVNNKQGTLQWTRSGFGLGVERNLTGFDRYHMTGSDEEGDFTLDIDPVMLEDDAKFQCQVGAAREPEIINGKEVRKTEDRKVILECVSKGGKPPAEITWVDSSGTVVTDGVTYTTEPVENTKRVTAKSKLEFIAQKSHHNASFTCEAQNSADPVPKKASIKILVEYAPDVKIELLSPRNKVRELEDVKFRCKAHANPSKKTFRWFVNDVVVPGNHVQELVIKKVTREQNGQIVKCEVTNDVGKSEEIHTLDISYAPQFTLKPRDVSGEKDHEAFLDCEVDGNPSPTYTWFRNGDMNTVIGYDRNLSLIISPSTIGKYICRASVQGFSEIMESADVMMKGPPRVIRRNGVQFGTEGDTVHLTCEAFSIPPPTTLKWSLYGYPVETVSPHYSLIETAKKRWYEIHASHTELHFIRLWRLQLYKSLPLIIILSAVIGGIVLTVMTILIMIICRRGTLRAKLTAKSKLRSGRSTSTTNSSGKNLNSAESEVLNPTSKNYSPENDIEHDWDRRRESMIGPPDSAAARYMPLQGYDDYQTRIEMGYPPQNHHPSTNSILDSGYIGGGPINHRQSGFINLPYGYDIQPHPAMAQSAVDFGELNSYRSGLNVADPRLSAKYGNHYLRSTPSTSVQQLHNPYVSPSQQQLYYPKNNASGMSPNGGAGGSVTSKGYSTLTTDRVRKKGSESNKALANGSNSNGGTLTKKNPYICHSVESILNGGNSQQQQQYILSPESESKNNSSMATHV